MKSTTQIIAAAAFASLLFAPLANANPGGGDIKFSLTNAALISITAKKIDFGEVIPDGVNDAILTITCNGDGDNNSATTSVDNFDTRVTGDPTCGVVTVKAGTAPITYTLAVTDVTDLIGESHSISPTLIVHEADSSADSPPIITAPGEKSDIDLAANTSDIFKVAGSMPIAADQAEGTYTGTYTVTAEVQTP